VIVQAYQRAHLTVGAFVSVSLASRDLTMLHYHQHHRRDSFRS